MYLISHSHPYRSLFIKCETEISNSFNTEKILTLQRYVGFGCERIYITLMAKVEN